MGGVDIETLLLLLLVSEEDGCFFKRCVCVCFFFARIDRCVMRVKIAHTPWRWYLRFFFFWWWLVDLYRGSLPDLADLGGRRGYRDTVVGF